MAMDVRSHRGQRVATGGGRSACSMRWDKPSTSNGLHGTASPSSTAAPVNSDSTSDPLPWRACWTVTYSLATRLIPSMSGVTSKAQRPRNRRRAGRAAPGGRRLARAASSATGAAHTVRRPGMAPASRGTRWRASYLKGNRIIAQRMYRHGQEAMLRIAITPITWPGEGCRPARPRPEPGQRGERRDRAQAAAGRSHAR